MVDWESIERADDVSYVTVNRTDYERMKASFLETVCLSSAVLSGEPDWKITLRIQAAVATMTRQEAIDVFHALSRKLLAQEYLQGIEPHQVVEPPQPKDAES